MVQGDSGRWDSYLIRGRHRQPNWIFGIRDAYNHRLGRRLGTILLMPTLTACGENGCKGPVPGALETVHLCVLHFTMKVEQECAQMRRETVYGKTPHARQVEIIRYIAEHGEMLSRASTSGLQLADEMKARILNTFLTLMNLRENLDRAALRQPIGRSG
jgi:hypothetical protein